MLKLTAHKKEHFSEMENIFDCSDCLNCKVAAAAKEKEEQETKRLLGETEMNNKEKTNNDNKNVDDRRDLQKRLWTGNEFKRENPRSKDEHFSCSTCNFKTRTKLKMKWHVLNEHGDESEKSACPKFFKYSGLQCILFECGECDHVSDRYTTMKRHIAVSHIGLDEQALFSVFRASKSQNLEKEFRCNRCTFSAKSRATIMKHIDYHKNTNSENQSTSEGKYVVLSPSEKQKGYVVTRANKRLNISKKFRCVKCCYSSKTKVIMKRHVENHSGDGKRELSCRKCSYSTQQLGEYLTHRKSHSYGKRCPKCEYQSNDLKDYKTHKESHKKPMKKIKTDSLAGKQFEEIINQLEGIDKRFDCTKCDYKTKFEGHLKKHYENCHTSCKICAYIGASTVDMKTHIEEEHRECLTVPGSSSKGYTVVRANGDVAFVRKFRCCKCDYSSKTRLSIKKHVGRHQSDGFHVFNCSKCDFTTQEIGAFRNHKRYHRLSMKRPKGNYLKPPREMLSDEIDSLKTPIDSLMKRSEPMKMENFSSESVQSDTEANIEDIESSLKKINQIADALKNFKDLKPNGSLPNSVLRMIEDPGSNKGYPKQDAENPIEENAMSVGPKSLLESIYQKNNYPGKDLKQDVALKTGLSLAKIQIIFSKQIPH